MNLSSLILMEAYMKNNTFKYNYKNKKRNSNNNYSKGVTLFINSIIFLFSLIIIIIICFIKNLPHKNLQLFNGICLLIGSIYGSDSRRHKSSGFISAFCYLLFIISKTLFDIMSKNAINIGVFDFYFLICALLSLLNAYIISPSKSPNRKVIIPSNRKNNNNSYQAPNNANYTNIQFNKSVEQKPIENIQFESPFSKGSYADNFISAAIVVVESQRGSVSLLQRRFKIGFNRANKIMEQLYEAGIVGPEDPSKLRNVLWDTITFEKKEYLIEFAKKLQDAHQESNEIYIADSNNSSSYKLNDFDNMDGHSFEYFCADLLNSNGFSKVKVTQGSGDDGIDILAEKDGISYGIQCKCYSDNIGNKAVQEAYTGVQMYHVDVGVVLTNRFFTDSAINTAKKTRIKLWDRNKLLELINTKNTNA